MDETFTKASVTLNLVRKLFSELLPAMNGEKKWQKLVIFGVFSTYFGRVLLIVTVFMFRIRGFGVPLTGHI